MTSLVDAESVLAIDIGSLNTRALLFDLVDGQYHFISATVAPTTAGAPFRDVSEGVHIALQRLQEVTGRTVLDNESRLIIPTQSDGAGVDRLALTVSAGGDLNLVTMGLLSDVSLQSAQKLAGTTYSRIVESVGLNDRRRPDAQLDAVLLSRPDVIIISGGTDKGATRSVNRLVDLAGQACRILPKDRRPRILFCGNQTLGKRVKENLERDAFVTIAPNIRPTIDLEDIGPASTQLAKVTAKIRAQQLGGLAQYVSVSSAPLLPSAFALGRMMRFMSEISPLAKPTLGLDLGAGATTLAAASSTGTQLSVSSSLGIGTGLSAALQQIKPEEVAEWVPYDTPVEEIRDYLYQKSLFPAALPLTPESLSIEQALARVLLRYAAQKFAERYPALRPSFEYIFVSGAALTQAPTPAQSLMMVLDGLQPVGVNVLMLDPHGLSQALGAIAGTNTLLPAHILESGAYTNLATVICPVSDARPGSTILRLKINYEQGGETRVEIKQGSVVRLPIRHGQVASLQVEALHGTVLDPSAPRLNRGVKSIVGGVCGVVVDARGRSIRLPGDPARRREQIKTWSQAIEDR